MKRKIEEPKTTLNKHGEKIQTHPAFGLVKTSRVSTTGIRLFDSELEHRDYIEIGVYEAELSLDNERTRPQRSSNRRPLVEIRLSQAQWAAMVSSFGVGEGVPCTISYKTIGDSIRVHGIAEQKSIRQKFNDQIKAATNSEIDRLNQQVSELGELVKKGRAGKRDLEELYRKLASAVANLPENLCFATELMQEQMDEIVSSGKAEIEAYVAGTVMRKGLAALGTESCINDDPTVSITKMESGKELLP
ncbi:TPA: hypothetical protein SI587_002515 [Escherichia coli]|nr:hypothetical protein [Escherichia coli]